MNIEPAAIRAEMSALLGELPEISDDIEHSALDLEAVARRLEEAHEVLVRALESVDPTHVASAANQADDDAERIGGPAVGVTDLSASRAHDGAEAITRPHNGAPTWETDR